MKQTARHGAGIGSLFLLFALAPVLALAQVKITEVMYDAPGADDGREWIEITNTGSSEVNIGKYKLLESGTHHGLNLVSGSALLGAGSSAVIAADATKFIADYPSYSGALFDSAFSLSNAGESLEIEDASTSPLDSIFYAAQAGANGEGGSLHLEGSTFAAAMPNPGTYPGALAAVPPPAAKAVPIKQAKAAPAKAVSAKVSAAKPASTKAVQGSSPEFTQAAAAAAESPQIPPLYLWIAGCAAVVLLGMAGICVALLQKKETSAIAEEFKIE